MGLVNAYVVSVLSLLGSTSTAAAAALHTPAAPAPAPAAAPVFPFEWDTVGSRLYSFCYGDDYTELSETAVKALSRSKLMIHGMEQGALLPPAWRESERKTGLAAAQLRELAPDQLQLYTVQTDFTRTIYASGIWFAQHPECCLKDSEGNLVTHNGTAQKPPNHNECDIGADPATGDAGHCFVYGFDTECGAQAWTQHITDAVETYNLDGVFVDGFQGCSPQGCSLTRQSTAATQAAFARGLNKSLWALHKNFTTGKNAKKKKKIICNRTGGTYNCAADGQCFCSASNEERWGGGSDGVVVLTDYKAETQGAKGVVVHVPHIAMNNAIYNSSLASYLLGAADGDGFGIGFDYPCEQGGWYDWDSGTLDQPLGQPLGPVNLTNTTAGGCDSLDKPGYHPSGCYMTRAFASGTHVYMNATAPAVGARLATCIVWGDGSTTARNDGCVELAALAAQR